jgi:elongation factor 1-alpha
VKEGDEVFLGPDSTGEFIETKVQSIEIHHYRVEQGMAGDVVGIAVKGIKSEHIRRGMVLTKSKPAPVRTFTAEVLVFNHPTRIGVGYEPVIHLETISESVVFEEIEKKYLKAGDRGRVKIRFKYHPYHILKGQKFIFREGRSKGFGRVISCEAEL